MATSPPGSPAAGGAGGVQRPLSQIIRPSRTSSRMSFSSRTGAPSRASDDENTKTAVKVAVRVRPPLQPSDPGYDLVPQRFRGSTVQVTTPTSLTVESAQGKKLFVFDRVFESEIEQEGVWEYLQESVASFVTGYNVSILAYGQSGAGKSYTMGTSGPAEQANPKLMGVVPRAAAALFEQLGSTSTRSGIRSPMRYSVNGLAALQNIQKQAAEKNWKMTATYVEIYQEQLRDLLLDDSISYNERPPVMIREDPKGRIILTGLKQVPIASVEDLLNALNFGSAIRQTDSTAINARSSRSHAVFSINLIQKKSQTTSVKDKRRSVPIEAMSGSFENMITVESKLHFVDLAGSERLKNTGAQGERAKEGISINAGLASLGKVIAQLSSSTRQAGAHVSYRDSKLTRLLQDSLGGNAITYMVACVNPVEFHLSETLNTVQYAQRARAIQSKPQIQATNDDSDKQAVIDRLRAEVSFLRDQIRLSGRATAPKERDERQHEREVELQNQLLDIQENYNALSHRHAKLISEITKARDDESGDTPVLKDAIGESALERLRRSNSFAEAVEQVVLEYEKTIQSLESSLSQTRSGLSSTESQLLEKETKLAYTETLNQQLQSRVQKAMDRESNDDNYLRDLESRMAGAATGEEKNNAIIASLKKELARARENETSCEEYISTLEERLAESEQDHEMMQREIDRLEHVVERQRSIGKLDALLQDLDSARGPETRSAAEQMVNGHVKQGSSDSFHSFARSARGSRRQSVDEGEDVAAGAVQPTSETLDDFKHEDVHTSVLVVPARSRPDEADEPASPAQSRFVADKLEAVTQELFDLRVEHETTAHDFDELQRKYQVALQTLAELQDAVEESRRPRASVYIPAGANSLGAELSTAEDPADAGASERAVSEVGDAGAVKEVEIPSDLAADSAAAKQLDLPVGVAASNLSPKEELLAQEMQKLKELNIEKENYVAELTENYAQLQEKHQDTLDYVEELKVEVQKAHISGRASPSPQIIRRKSSQPLVSSDRATRSFASLRNMALENFEDDPDKLQSFELNINAAMNELHTRSERITDLESEVTSLRKEMESKMTIISGLTRERTSLVGSSPLDMSAISSMQEQLLESENRLRGLQEAQAVREKELLDQIEGLKGSLATRSITDMPGQFPATPGLDSDFPKDVASNAHGQQVTELQKEVEDWRSKHDSALESMKASEQQLLATISGLELSLRNAQSQSTGSREITHEKADSAVSAVASEDFAEERRRHEHALDALQKEVDEHKQSASAAAQRLADLEQSHNTILRQVQDDSTSRSQMDKELESHRILVTNLESQLEEHKNAIAMHQQGLESLKELHSKELDSLTAANLAAQKETNDHMTKIIEEHQAAVAQVQTRLDQTHAEHAETTAALQAEVEQARQQMKEFSDTTGLDVASDSSDSTSLIHHVQSIVNSHRNTLQMYQTTKAELETTKAATADSERKFDQLRLINDETIKELERISDKEKKSSKLVDELEAQLNNNFDQQKVANNRLSQLQAERQYQLEETKRELDDSRSKLMALENQLADAKRRSQRESLDPRDADLQRSNSSGGGLRKSSVSAGALPSPPPAIPLPPLPGSPPGGVVSGAPSISPPTSRHQSKDLLASAQLVEDQEARIRTIEKHLFAEKQLTATLEEALTDLESSSTKMKSEMEAWRRKCLVLEEELGAMRKQRENSRLSVQQLEEERDKRKQLEAQQARLEARLTALSTGKKKKASLNCF